MVAVQGGFHRWSVVDVATVLVRGARTVPHGWTLVVEAEQGLEGVVGDGKLSRRYPVLTGAKVSREMESMIMKVLCLLVEVWKCC